MTTDPNSDRVLERLLAAARSGTEPSPEARARIRAGVEQRLSGGDSAQPARNRRLPVALGAAVVAAAVLAVWWAGVPHPGAVHEPPPAASVRPISPDVALPLAEAAKAPPAPETARSAASDSGAVMPVPSAVESQRTRTKAVASTSDWPAGADELTLIRQMQQALRSGNPQRALGFVAEHERRFPSGSLTEEREGARAAARCELAPRERASILATFAARFGTSPYLERVKAACR